MYNHFNQCSFPRESKVARELTDVSSPSSLLDVKIAAVRVPGSENTLNIFGRYLLLSHYYIWCPGFTKKSDTRPSAKNMYPQKSLDIYYISAHDVCYMLALKQTYI